jgi:hypothetical protein
MTDIARLIAACKRKDLEVWIAGGASEEQVSVLEGALGVSLPPSYFDFLTSYGALGVGDSFVSGIINNDALDRTGGSVLGDTLEFREFDNFPPGFVVVGKHEDGAYCLDANRQTANREYPVVNFEFASIQHGLPVAPSFGVWLIQFYLGGEGMPMSPDTSPERTRGR